MTRPSPTPALLVLLVAGSIFVFMLQWLQLPLYPDEAAMRLYAARAYTDGLVQYKLFPQCDSNLQPIPLTLAPAAYALGLLDGWDGWGYVRLLPLLALACLLAAVAKTVLAQCRGRDAWPLAFLCAGFIGVSGAGLIMARPEMLLLLQLAAIVATFLAARRKPSLPVQLLWTVLQLATITLALATHMLGLMLLPLNILALLRLWHGNRLASVANLLLLAAIAWQAIPYWQFTCTEDKPLAAAFHDYQGAALAVGGPKTGLARLKQRLALYPTHFRYQQQFNPVYLPPADRAATRLANIPIYLTAVASLLAVFGIACMLSWQLLQHYRRRIHHWRDLYTELLFDERLPVAGAALTFLALFAYDLSSNFYRVFFLQLMAAILMALAATQLRHRRWQWVIRLGGAGLILLCLISTLANHFAMVPRFARGYEGMGTSLATDWASIGKQVDTIAPRCGIGPGTERIMVEDRTYEALRHHRHPLHFIYFWFSEVVTHGHRLPLSPAQKLQSLKTAHPSAVVARCILLEGEHLPVTARAGEICCLKF